MRTIQQWENTIKEKLITEKFSERLQRDLRALPFPDTLPEIRDGLFLYGPVSSGKTVLSAQLLLREMRCIYLEGGPQNENDTCLLIPTTELLNLIKSTFNSTTITEQSVIDMYSSVRLLVLDDFGTTKITDWVLNVFYTIINRRYEGLKKTIINSNMSLDEIAIMFGDCRITSRIDRMCQLYQKEKTW